MPEDQIDQLADSIADCVRDSLREAMATSGTRGAVAGSIALACIGCAATTFVRTFAPSISDGEASRIGEELGAQYARRMANDVAVLTLQAQAAAAGSN